MNKLLLTAVLLLTAGAAWSCPLHIEGSDVKMENIEDGVLIRVTSKDKAVVAKIQAAAKEDAGHGKAKAAKGETYACPMKGCYVGPNTKSGMCPHCGMKLEKKKD